MKKSVVKSFGLMICVLAAVALTGCKHEPKNTDTPATSSDNPPAEEPAQTVTFSITAQEGYENTITKDDSAKTITLEPAEKKVSYTITGSYDGQIINKTEGTILILSNATLTNSEGKPAIYGELKTEIKCDKDTTNTITVTGPSADKTGAVLCEEKIEIGGSGTLTVTCENAHGVKGDKVELKGSGTYVFDGGANNSALNCNDFEVGTEKTFTATFKNSKNGIKADYTIKISSGTFNFKDITETALKTGTKNKKDGTVPEITLTGGTFTFENCAVKQSTVTDGFTKSENVNGNFD